MLKQYYFRFANGVVRKFTEDGAKRFSKDIQSPIVDCSEENDFKNNRRIKDGFQPGWQPQLGMVVTCYGRYKEICRERGLIELGNEKPRSHAEDIAEIERKQQLAMVSDSVLREIANEVGGLDLSDGDVRSIRDSI